MSPSLPDTRTLLADLGTWLGRLKDQTAGPLTGPTRETDALLYGRMQSHDDTLFLYGYPVGTREHCFFYDTPWDERGRVPRPGHLEWYDGLEMPRVFRVRYSVSEPDQHEILDPLLGEMMKRTLHRVGTRLAVAHPLTASAAAVLAQFDRWEERLPLLRRGEWLTPASAPEVEPWPTARARFGDVVGREEDPFLSYSFDVGSTRYVFVMRLTQPDSRMTPSDYSPDSSRAERRAHLARVREREQALRSLVGARDVPVRFQPENPGRHALPPELDAYTRTFQLEPIVFPR